jgi:hypothetical protein
MTNTVIFMTLGDLRIRHTTAVPVSPLHIWIWILVVYVVKISREHIPYNLIFTTNSNMMAYILSTSICRYISTFSTCALKLSLGNKKGQTKDYEIVICSFSTKHAALRQKRKDWLARNQNNVFEWSDMSTCKLLFQWASTIKIQLSMLV